MADGGGSRGLKEQREQQQQQDGGERGPRASGRRAAAAAAAPAPGPVRQVPAAARRSSAAARARRVRDAVVVVQRLLAARAPGALLVVVLLVVVVVQAPVRAAAARAVAQLGAEAQAGHVLFDRLADGPLQAVAHTVVEQRRLGHGQHVLDDRAALVGAAQPVEELPAVGQVAAERQVAAAVAVAAPPGLGAAHDPARARAARATAARPGQARLNGALGGLAVLVLRAVTVLQGGPAARVVELNKGRDAVARAAPARREGRGGGREGGGGGGGPRRVAPAALRQHRRARLGVLVVGVAALRLPLALQQRLPADEAAAVRQPGAPRRRAQQLQQRHQAQPGARHGPPAGPAAAAQEPCHHRGQRRPPGEERKGHEARGAADAEPAEKFAPVLPTSCMSVFINPCAPLAGAPLLAEGRLSLGLQGAS